MGLNTSPHPNLTVLIPGHNCICLAPQDMGHHILAWLRGRICRLISHQRSMTPMSPVMSRVIPFGAEIDSVQDSQGGRTAGGVEVVAWASRAEGGAVERGADTWRGGRYSGPPGTVARGNHV